MTSSPHEAPLRARIAALQTQLASQQIALEIRETSWREYHVHINVVHNGSAAGFATVYYAPSRQAFTVQTREVSSPLVASILTEAFSMVPAVPKASVPSVAVAAGISAYVDGSYDRGRVGYGAVILRDGSVAAELCGRMHEYTDSRQVAGELRATMEVIRWCQTNQITKVTIAYDYAGIEKWAKGRWEAKLPLTQDYQAFMRGCGVRVTFIKVKSHTGDRWNEAADVLAKKGTTL